MIEGPKRLAKRLMEGACRIAMKASRF
jgi:hypothetical protein